MFWASTNPEGKPELHQGTGELPPRRTTPPHGVALRCIICCNYNNFQGELGEFDGFGAPVGGADGFGFADDDFGFGDGGFDDGFDDGFGAADESGGGGDAFCSHDSPLKPSSHAQ